MPYREKKLQSQKLVCELKAGLNEHHQQATSVFTVIKICNKMEGSFQNSQNHLTPPSTASL